MSRIFYDLTSYESALNSLSIIIKVIPVKLEMFLFRYRNNNDDLYNNLIENFKININDIDISDLYLKVLQVTTNGDNCESIRRYGLLNTQEAIQSDTFLSRYLNRKGITIDFINKTIRYKNNLYHISEDNNRHIKLCFIKLFSKCHYPINGFIYSDNPMNYGDQIDKKPEIIGNLADAFGRDIEKEWIQNTKCFIIEFMPSIYDFDYSVFTDNKELFEDNKDLVIKRWLLGLSIVLLHDLKYDNHHVDVYAYMNPEYSVLNSDNLINFEEG
ncbi:hypothetical protein [uncultured Clostridium sp.]|uniref:hypothetical protein n=1 Tax=uncultured Clostridium sp. TaxID=59620 RepID=UPI0028E89B4D|nr:hypothetical protein [uncultured Clostridium sp.]